MLKNLISVLLVLLLLINTGITVSATDGFESGIYVSNSSGENDVNPGKILLICLIVGLAVGVIVALALKAQLKSVRKQRHANVYIKDGNLRLTQQGDFFLYRNVTRREKPQNNSAGSRN